MLSRMEHLESLKTGFFQQATVGTICPWSYSLIPQGWLLCDGQEVSLAEYPALFRFLNPHENADAATFHVPAMPSPFQGVFYIIRASQ